MPFYCFIKIFGAFLPIGRVLGGSLGLFGINEGAGGPMGALGAVERCLEGGF